MVALSPDQQVLKGAVRALVRAFGGQEAAAAQVGRVQSAVSDWCSVNRPAFMPVDAVAALEAVTQGAPGWPHVTRALAQASGHALIRLPEAAPLEGDVFEWMARLSKEFGDVVAELGSAQRGIKTSIQTDPATLRKEIHELQTLLAGMDAGLAEIERAG